MFEEFNKVYKLISGCEDGYGDCTSRRFRRDDDVFIIELFCEDGQQVKVSITIGSPDSSQISVDDGQDAYSFECAESAGKAASRLALQYHQGLKYSRWCLFHKKCLLKVDEFSGSVPLIYFRSLLRLNSYLTVMGEREGIFKLLAGMLLVLLVLPGIVFGIFFLLLGTLTLTMYLLMAIILSRLLFMFRLYLA